MLSMRRRLVCCSNDRDASLDFDEQDGVMTYNGLESCILNRQTYEYESRTSRGDECASECMEDYDSSCSSSKDAFGSFSFKWLSTKKDRHGLAEWDVSESPPHFYAREKPPKAVQVSDVDAMKEKFAKLLLGEDVTGGQKGITTALALSNGITNLAVTIFGELWKLEPLHEERKARWQREMSWLLSPTHYMVELIPTKQNSADGGILEIMTPKIRADIHMNLPALQKLDSMLIEALDSMVNTEFWYEEGGSRAEGRSKSAVEGKKWWLPSPRVPPSGLSEAEKKKLLTLGRVVYQVLKAAQSINQSILSEMPVPTTVKEAFCKCGRTNLSEELFKILTGESSTAEHMLNSLNLKSEHSVLEVINRLEAAVFAWKERIKEQDGGKSPIRTSWSSFIKDSISEREKLELLLDRGEALHQLLKMRHPNLPQSFLDAKKVQHGKDVGYAIMEAYSRVLGNLAFSILSRIGDILQEDALTNPKSAVASIGFPVLSCTTSPDLQSFSIQMNKVEAQFYDSAFGSSSNSDAEFSCSEAKSSSVTATPKCSEAKSSSVTATPSWGRPSCLSKEACSKPPPINWP